MRKRSKIADAFEPGLTCETEDWENSDRKDTKMLMTRVLSVAEGPRFTHSGIVEYLNGLLKLESESENTQEMLTTKTDRFLIDLPEEGMHNWLPSPSYVHPISMDFPTPKQGFSPEKPNKFIYHQ